MTDQEIQLGLHLTQLIDDRLFFLRMKSHPHSTIGAGFLMAILHGRDYATNAEVAEALALAYKTIPDVVGSFVPDAPGMTGPSFLKEDQFVSMTLQLLDLLHGLKYVPATGNYLIMQDFYNYY